MAQIGIVDINRLYPNGIQALQAVRFEVKQDELVAVLGPPGAGKTVLLRLIAGLETPDSGRILFDGEPAPEDLSIRNAAMMFQNYGLRPGLTVYQNLALGLKLRGVEKTKLDMCVREAAKESGFYDLLNQKPGKLSLLQQKRVQLARAIVRRPAVFLLDEPLAGLSVEERETFGAEIAKLQKCLGIPFVLATREWPDAKMLADRMLVLNGGAVMGLDSPQNLYDNPPNAFTAGYLGDPPMNFIKAELKSDDSAIRAVFGENSLLIEPSRAHAFIESFSREENQVPVRLGFRPKDVQIEMKAGPDRLQAVVDTVEQQDAKAYIYLKISGKSNPIIAVVNEPAPYRAGDIVYLTIDPRSIFIFNGTPNGGNMIQTA